MANHFTCFLLVGKVVWVGSSSLDVLVEVHTASTTDTVTNSSDQPSILLSSFFTYVARNQDTNKAAAVNHLLLSTAEEEALHAQRVLLATQRKAQRTAPSASTDAELGDTLQKLIESGNALQDMPALAHSNAVLMKLTGLENSVVCQPQNVNTGGRVFGGYISKYPFLLLFLLTPVLRVFLAC